ncbi:MAG: hypothetical protein ACKO55_11075 [Bacteroidota bacterium]
MGKKVRFKLKFIMHLNQKSYKLALIGLILWLNQAANAQSPDLDRYTSSKGTRKAKAMNSENEEGDTWASRHPEFMQELTTGLYWYQIPTVPDNVLPMSSQIFLQGFNYVPRYALWKGGDIVSLTAGSNLGFALQISNFGSLFMVNVPLNFELNLGRGSMADNDDPVGIYAGLGIEYNFVNNLFLASDLNQFGLQWTGGIRAKFQGRPMVVRISRTLGTPSQKVAITHLGLGISMF